MVFYGVAAIAAVSHSGVLSSVTNTSPVPGQSFDTGQTFPSNSVWYKWEISDDVGEAIKGGTTYQFTIQPTPECDPANLFVYAKAGGILTGATINPGGTVTIPQANFIITFAVSETAWTFTVTGEGAPYGLSNWGFLCKQPTVKTGDLVISKTAYFSENDVRTLDTDTTTEFIIEIHNADGLVEGDIKLTNGGSVTKTLPVGDYTVKEVDAKGYVADKDEFTATIIADKTETVDFVNVRVIPPKRETGDLVITKTAYFAENGVRTIDTDTTTEFIIEIHNADGLVEGNIKLTNGGSVTRTLPVGDYTVKEVDAKHYVADKDEFSATITAGKTATVDFVNVRVIPPKGENGYLIITKKAYIADENGDRTLDENTVIEFTFEIHNADGLVEGNIKLTNGGSVTKMLPVGDYTVKEVDARGYVADEYKFTVMVAAEETKTVTFINVLDELPKTNGLDVMLLTLGAGLAGAGFVIRRRKHK
jgi:LPXTG-motif cell wall-anchored protein